MKTCVVAIQKNETNLIEWSKWHLDICGFSNIFLYNHECGPYEYLDKRVIQYQVFGHGKSAPQFKVYNDFVKSYSKDFDYALFIDADEYLNLHGLTIDQIIEQQFDQNTYVVGFNWIMYGSKTDNPDDILSCIKRFKFRNKTFEKEQKILVDFKRINSYGFSVDFINPHVLRCRNPFGLVNTKLQTGEVAKGPLLQIEGDPLILPYIAHYYCRTKDEFAHKIQRGRADCSEKSQYQYFNNVDFMWKQFNKYNGDLVYDDEIYNRYLKYLAEA